MEDPADRISRITRILKGEQDTSQNTYDFSGVEGIESIIETKSSNLEEISRMLDIDRTILNQIINIALIISILTLITVALWLYNSYSSFSSQILIFSAVALALVNIVVAFKIKRLVSR